MLCEGFCVIHDIDEVSSIMAIVAAHSIIVKRERLLLQRWMVRVQFCRFAYTIVLLSVIKDKIIFFRRAYPNFGHNFASQFLFVL